MAQLLRVRPRLDNVLDELVPIGGHHVQALVRVRGHDLGAALKQVRDDLKDKKSFKSNI